jgi:hypothetical protein
MNEKIKQLAEQATTIVGVEHGHAFDREVIDQEKFAGLIQYEIIKVIEGCHYRNGIDSDHNKALNMAVEEIKKHFGVEL